MSDVSIVNLRSPAAISVSTALAHGLALATADGGDPHVLPSGSSHLVLPPHQEQSGPMAFAISGDAGGSVLTGVGQAVETLEWALIGAMLAFINVGATTVSTSADNVGSPVGQRFGGTTEIHSGFAMLFVRCQVGGELKWFPLTGTVPG